jgi:hypothetical protein
VSAAAASREASHEDLRRLDPGVYAAVPAAPAPTLDAFLKRVSSAAGLSRL